MHRFGQDFVTDFHQTWQEHLNQRPNESYRRQVFKIFFKGSLSPKSAKIGPFWVPSVCTAYSTRDAFLAIGFILSGRAHTGTKEMLFLVSFFRIVPFWNY